MDYVAVLITAAIIGFVAVIAFAAARLIDYCFKKKEQNREYFSEERLQNNKFLMDLTLTKRQQELGYQYNKQLMQSGIDRFGVMSEKLVKKINDGVWESAKKMMQEFEE